MERVAIGGACSRDDDCVADVPAGLEAVACVSSTCAGIRSALGVEGDPCERYELLPDGTGVYHQCAVGLICDVSPSGLRCARLRTDGEDCSTARCQPSLDCDLATHTCVAHVPAPGDLGQPCDRFGVCLGETAACDGTTCVAATGALGDWCDPGDADCAVGLRCGVDHRCASASLDGGPCNLDTECVSLCCVPPTTTCAPWP